MDNLDEIEKLLEEKKREEAIIKARAEAEAKEIALIAQDPTKAVATKLSEKLVKTLDKSDLVDTKVTKTSEILIDNGLKEQENKAVANVIKSEDATLEADFVKNKNEYLYHGINHKIDKQWKRTLVHIINDIWFVIWAIVSCFTLVPVSTFLSRISALKGFIKGVAMVLGIFMLLACVGGLTYMCLKWTGVIG